MGLRVLVGARYGRHRANVYFLHGDQCGRREALFAEVSCGTILASFLPFAKNNGRFCSAHVDPFHILFVASELCEKAQYEKHSLTAQDPGHQIHHGGHSLVLPLLDAEPRHYILGCSGQVERDSMG